MTNFGFLLFYRGLCENVSDIITGICQICNLAKFCNPIGKLNGVYRIPLVQFLFALLKHLV